MAKHAEERQSISKARITAAVFLLLGLLLGIVDAPQYAARAFEWAGVPGVSARMSAVAERLPYRLGLDIQGGAHLVYQADTSVVAPEDVASSMAALRDVVERRINLFGVGEPTVQVVRVGGERRLIVEIAGVEDTTAAIEMIGRTPFLEFRTERPIEERDQILAQLEADPSLFEDPYFIPSPLTGRYVSRADIAFDPNTSQASVSLELTEEGGDIFAQVTSENIGKPLAIYLDGVPISAPIVQSEITGGRAQITGNFTPAEARELAGRLNAGALPVPIELISQQTVGATLGKESLEKSFRAGVFGLLAVVLFMIFWYRLRGVVAVLALLFYISVLLVVFKLIPVTLTLAGMAGVILSIGMAVDANILIFERIKEEMRAGKEHTAALRRGFARAWTSIRDSNISSLITASILYWFGTSVVRGFALTLGIGLLISMFSAMVVTRAFLSAMISKRT